MDNLVQGLQKLKFNHIIIVDNTQANIDAAKIAISDLLGIDFTFYNSARDVLQAISRNPDDIDLIITDMSMEENMSGLNVVEAGFNQIIPVIVVSGGFQHANSSQIRLSPDIRPSALNGDKRLPKTWKEILNTIVASACVGSVLKGFIMARDAGMKPQNSEDIFSLGKHAKLVVNSFFECSGI